MSEPAFEPFVCHRAESEPRRPYPKFPPSPCSASVALPSELPSRLCVAHATFDLRLVTLSVASALGRLPSAFVASVLLTSPFCAAACAAAAAAASFSFVFFVFLRPEPTASTFRNIPLRPIPATIPAVKPRLLDVVIIVVTKLGLVALATRTRDVIIRFRRLLSLPLNLGRLRLCRRPARDHTSTRSRFLRLAPTHPCATSLAPVPRSPPRTRSVSASLSRTERPDSPFLRPALSVARRNSSSESPRISHPTRPARPDRDITHSSVTALPRSRASTRSPTAHYPPPPHTRAAIIARGRRIASVSDAPIPSFSRRRPTPPRERPRPSSRDRARTSSSSRARARVPFAPRVARCRRDVGSSSAARATAGTARPAPVDRSVGRRAPDPLVRGRAVGRAMRVFFHGRARGCTLR